MVDPDGGGLEDGDEVAIVQELVELLLSVTPEQLRSKAVRSGVWALIADAEACPNYGGAVRRVAEACTWDGQKLRVNTADVCREIAEGIIEACGAPGGEEEDVEEEVVDDSAADDNVVGGGAAAAAVGAADLPSMMQGLQQNGECVQVISQQLAELQQEISSMRGAALGAVGAAAVALQEGEVVEGEEENASSEPEAEPELPRPPPPPSRQQQQQQQQPNPAMFRADARAAMRSSGNGGVAGDGGCGMEALLSELAAGPTTSAMFAHLQVIQKDVRESRAEAEAGALAGGSGALRRGGGAGGGSHASKELEEFSQLRRRRQSEGGGGGGGDGAANNVFSHANRMSAFPEAMRGVPGYEPPGLMEKWRAKIQTNFKQFFCVFVVVAVLNFRNFSKMVELVTQDAPPKAAPGRPLQ